MLHCMKRGSAHSVLHLVIKTISSEWMLWISAGVEFLTAATPTCVMKLNLCVLSILQEVYSQTAQGCCCCCIMYYFHSLCRCGLNLSQNAGCSLSLCVPCVAMGFLNNHGWAFLIYPLQGSCSADRITKSFNYFHQVPRRQPQPNSSIAAFSYMRNKSVLIDWCYSIVHKMSALPRTPCYLSALSFESGPVQYVHIF